MSAAKESQCLIVEALQAEADTVHARGGKVGEPFRLRAIRVGLKRYFEIARHVPMVVRRRNNRPGSGWLHQGRRPATKEDGAETPVRQQCRFMGQVRQKRLAPLILVDRGADMTVEVAIWAFADAERPVDIQSQWLRRSSAIHFWLDSKVAHDAPGSYGPCPCDFQPQLLACRKRASCRGPTKVPNPAIHWSFARR